MNERKPGNIAEWLASRTQGKGHFGEIDSGERPHAPGDHQPNAQPAEHEVV